MQVIEERGAVQLEVESLDGWAGENREAEISRRAAEEAVRPFDLAHRPLLRVRVIKAGAEGQEHVLLLNMHHIVSDGWSRAFCCETLRPVWGLHRRKRCRAGAASCAVRRFRGVAAGMA